MNRRNGFAPIPRHVFGNPFFRKRKLRDPHPERFDQERAYTWLYTQAAYKDDEVRTTFGIFHIKRGQLCITIRDLGTIWHWPVGTVHRFLHRLKRNSWISLHLYNTGTEIGTRVTPLALETPYDRTVITICNYDAFPKISTDDTFKAIEKSERKSEHVSKRRRQPFHSPDQREMPVHGLVGVTGNNLNNRDSTSLSDVGEESEMGRSKNYSKIG